MKINILLITDVLEDFDFLNNTLRLIGYEPNILTAKNREEIEHELNQSVHLIVINQHIKSIEVQDLITFLDHEFDSNYGLNKFFFNEETPVIVLDENLDNWSKYISLGVLDVITKFDTPRFKHAINLGFYISKLKKEEKVQKKSLADADRRCNLLIEESALPIAYLTEGIHVKANKAYLDIFGASSFDEIDYLTLLDFIDKSFHPKIKEALKLTVTGEDVRVENVQFNYPKANLWVGTLILKQIVFDGEKSIQIVIELPKKTHEVDFNSSQASQKTSEMAKYQDYKEVKDDFFISKSLFISNIEAAILNAKTQNIYSGLIAFEQANLHEHATMIGIRNMDELFSLYGKKLHQIFQSNAIHGNVVFSKLNEHVFSVLLNIDNKENLEKLANEIQRTLAEDFIEFNSNTLSTQSFGAGIFIDKYSQDVNGVLFKLREKLKKARKSQQKNILIYEEKNQDKESEKRFEATKQKLIDVIQNNTLKDYLVPIVGLTNEVISHFEYKYKVLDGNQGRISVNELENVANELNLTADMNIRVLNNIISLINNNLQKNQKIYYSTKLYFEGLFDDKFTQFIQTINKDIAQHIEIIVDEMDAVTKINKINEFINLSNAIGMKVIIDNYVGHTLSEKLLVQNIRIDNNYLIEDAANLEKIKKKLSQNNFKKVIANHVNETKYMPTLFMLGVGFVQEAEKSN